MLPGTIGTHSNPNRSAAFYGGQSRTRTKKTTILRKQDARTPAQGLEPAAHAAESPASVAAPAALVPEPMERAFLDALHRVQDFVAARLQGLEDCEDIAYELDLLLEDDDYIAATKALDEHTPFDAVREIASHVDEPITIDSSVLAGAGEANVERVRRAFDAYRKTMLIAVRFIASQRHETASTSTPARPLAFLTDQETPLPVRKALLDAARGPVALHGLAWAGRTGTSWAAQAALVDMWELGATQMLRCAALDARLLHGIALTSEERFDVALLDSAHKESEAQLDRLMEAAAQKDLAFPSAESFRE